MYIPSVLFSFLEAALKRRPRATDINKTTNFSTA